MQGRESLDDARSDGDATGFGVTAPQISLPKGGGAVRGIGEKFSANPVTGTASMTVPLYCSPGRSGFGPQLSLSYDSGAGNGPFGLGWTLSTPHVSRRTDRGLPKYQDADESDIFILSGAEDLVPVLVKKAGTWQRDPFDSPASEPGYTIQRYRPRIEGAFIRIERWTDRITGISHWRAVSRDNVTTLYGSRADARIADAADPTRVFSWLICESYDDKGNAALYRYKQEDDTLVDRAAPCERNRLLGQPFPQRYLKSVCYGNRTPRQSGEDLTSRTDWLFEVVLDYGEHDAGVPTTKEVHPWPVRKDPFSLFRATFDIRTYRLCRRVLMFHHFPDELGGTNDYLVRSTDIAYAENSVASTISSVSQAGYVLAPDNTYFRKTLPKIEFQYSAVEVDETVHELDAASTRELPYGVDGTSYQWIDLDGEGLAGVLTEQADGWYYKRNLGEGTLGAVEAIAPRPATSALAGGRQQLLDLAGSGMPDLVELDGPRAGFYERTHDGGWEPFTPFQSIANVDVRDPYLRFIDVTGDGRSDILIAGDDVFVWYESLARQGFAGARRTTQARDEEKGARLIFSDPTQSIFFADMSGDGLTDLVRIRYDEVCYWPNLGYGRFGAKVAMGNAPLLDAQDQFDPARIRLADIDGSGNIDLIYLGRQGIALYFNQSGNFWSESRVLTHYPAVDRLKSIAAVDLLGTGTACLVWSSPLATDTRQPMRYIDLMGGQKPHLLTFMANNMGTETDVTYASSTKFYLRDRAEARPWITRLPFPVHVIERVESRDQVSGTRVVSTYRYRHGYFDGVEREFRGFAFVEQRDAESVVGQFDLPPVVTKTWFHTGALLEGSTLEAYFKEPDSLEYFVGDVQATFLPDTELSFDFTFDEMREAARALKGSILRQESYADDGTARASIPYNTSERSYRLKMLQPQGPNPHAVFLSHNSEILDYYYERDASDPRIKHALTLQVDDYGNVLESVSIGYARRTPAFDEQKSTLATLTENGFTNAVLEQDAYRTPLPAEQRTYELTAPGLAGAKPLDFAAVAAMTAAAAELDYEKTATPGATLKRLVARSRLTYRKDDLSALLPAGTVEALALPGESYRMAFTSGLLDVYQKRASHADLTGILTGADARYRDIDGASVFWAPSGRVFYSPNAADSAPQELTFARAHFFLPQRFRDAFGNDTVVSYDSKYTLLLASRQDAVGNEVLVEQDFRVLKPRLVTDANGNRTEMRFDAAGMLVGTALRGKAAGPSEGDSFASFTTDLTAAQIKAFFDADDPRALAAAHLGTVTQRFIYDLERVPVCAVTLSRETHVSDLAPGASSRVQMSFFYADGSGREAQTRVPAEPGPLDPDDAGSPRLDPRWIATGARIYDNKGNAVRQYEPFFSATPKFGIEVTGISSTVFHDPVGRAVATLNPNHTYSKTAFTSWQQTTWDSNDTVTFAPKSDVDVGQLLAKLPDADYLPTWHAQRAGGALGPDEKSAADKAAKHADTPAVAHFDTLGRTFLTIADNGIDGGGMPQKYSTRSVLDIAGNPRQLLDPLDRIVAEYDYDMLGNRIHQSSMESGERWMLNDCNGKSLRLWTGRKHVFRTEYDVLERPVRSFVQGGDPAEANPQVYATAILFERTIYGDSAETGLTEAQRVQANLRGRIYGHFDGAGVVTTERYDFKGNALQSRRQFTIDYQNAPDWSLNPPLESEVFSGAAAYDALNRAIQVTAPDKSLYRPTFNEANLLEKVDVCLRGAQLGGAPVWTPFVTNVDYDARGQRTLIEYANGGRTAYSYDSKTRRLTRLLTTRGAADALATAIFKSGTTIQDLHYTYDPVGNVVRVEDAALKTVFQGGAVVEAASDHTYDPLYRLTLAAGREHIGQSAFQFAPPDGNYRDHPFVGAALLNDPQSLRNYTEQYDYDAAGNFLSVSHQRAGSGWTRTYSYNEWSLIEATKKSNRLSQTALSAVPGAPVEPCSYDAHGNVTQMSHLPMMQWDFRDRLAASARQVAGATPEKTLYAYGADDQRARKVSVRQNGTRRTERRYLGGFEIYREYGANGTDILAARETLHVMDGARRIALVETRTIAAGGAIGAPQPVARYQLGNALDSACLELDDGGALISYEEYTPYGNTSFQAGRSAAEVALKRYRYTGKERDAENGFTYHGARYCAPWLGIWMSCDPAGAQSGLNAYQYARSNPVRYLDRDGRDPTPGSTERQPSGFEKNLDRVNRYLAIAGGPTTIAARSLSKAISDNIVTYIKEGSEKGDAQLEQNADQLIMSNIPVLGTVMTVRQGAQEVAESMQKVDDAHAKGESAAGDYVDAGLAIAETTVLVATDLIVHAHAPGKIYAKVAEPKTPKFIPSEPAKAPPPKAPPKMPDLPADSPVHAPTEPAVRPIYLHDRYGESIVGRSLMSKTFEINEGSRLESRIADDFNPNTGILNEFNTTPWSSMPEDKLQAKIQEKLKQVGKDIDLRDRGEITGAVWYGTEALPETGTASQLRRALEAAHIPYHVVPLPAHLARLRVDGA